MRFMWPLLAVSSLASALMDANALLRDHYEEQLVERGLMKRVQHSSSFAPYMPYKPDTLTDAYAPKFLLVPMNHFPGDEKYAPHSAAMFPMRYWFDDTFYKPGGPVILMSAGPQSGETQLKIMQKGVINRIAMATNGIVVIVEHRYYGASLPVGSFSPVNMRFLSTDQAVADLAWFAQNVHIPGHKKSKLSPKNTPWILYGSQYAGSLAAFARQSYPNLFIGAITSGAITRAITDFWEYNEAARHFSPGKCSDRTQKVIDMVDTILYGDDEGDKQSLRDLWGLSDLVDDVDFVNVLARGIQAMEAANWDPFEDNQLWRTYCENLNMESPIYDNTFANKAEIRRLLFSSGYYNEVDDLGIAVENFIGWTKTWVIKNCVGAPSTCFSRPDYIYTLTDVGQRWRPWVWQMCTEWGLFQTGTTVYNGQLPLISSKLTTQASMEICNRAFNRFDLPNTSIINRRGGLSFKYPRVAFINGEQDPWRAVTPHKINRNENLSNNELFYLIPDAGHAWDRNSIFKNQVIPGIFPPNNVIDAQGYEIWLAQKWIIEWNYENKLAASSRGPANSESRSGSSSGHSSSGSATPATDAGFNSPALPDNIFDLYSHVGNVNHDIPEYKLFDPSKSQFLDDFAAVGDAANQFAGSSNQPEDYVPE
ncbi:hypothetical protein BROUX41_003081 [Berkeleyomyces rouxiae]